MTEILITSSVLILALLLLRKLFQKTLSQRVQYALWGLVLLRLLTSRFSPNIETFCSFNNSIHKKLQFRQNPLTREVEAIY